MTATSPDHDPTAMPFQRPVIWVHEEALGRRNPALRTWTDTPALFVFDTDWISDAGISRKRLGFLYESALWLSGYRLGQTDNNYRVSRRFANGSFGRILRW